MKHYILIVERHSNSSFYQFISKSKATAFAKELVERYKADIDPIRDWRILE